MSSSKVEEVCDLYRNRKISREEYYTALKALMSERLWQHEVNK